MIHAKKKIFFFRNSVLKKFKVRFGFFFIIIILETKKAEYNRNCFLFRKFYESDFFFSEK
jgi:hypothetical protein